MQTILPRLYLKGMTIDRYEVRFCSGYLINIVIKYCHVTEKYMFILLQFIVFLIV